MTVLDLGIFLWKVGSFRKIPWFKTITFVSHNDLKNDGVQLLLSNCFKDDDC